MAVTYHQRTFHQTVLQPSSQTTRNHKLLHPETLIETPFQRTTRLLGSFLLKTLLVGLVSIGFLYCASLILAAPTGLLPKLIALMAWSCGFVPVTCYLWQSR
ncbi:hypothetical protein KFU94_60360 [Chloroflexi bacterium TSY]|nr:hypothetical protein [Chloroflexi bacterium TSY]